MERLVTPDGIVVAPDLRIAATIGARFLGLMGKRALPEGQALWIEPCSQVHTFFCRFRMDVAFLDRSGTIRHIAHAMRPWRIGRLVFGARVAVELPGGTLRAAGIDVGSVLRRETVAPETAQAPPTAS